MKTKLYLFIQIFISLILLNSCQQQTKIKSGEGFIDVTGGKVWYNIVGDGDKTPILLLHGGPGATSYYLNPLAELGKDRPVIFFDQLGCGRSGNTLDEDKMTIEFFVEEVHQVKEALGLKDFYLYGQSWGTTLGMDYYLKYPEGVKAIIFSSPAISMPMWAKDAEILLSEFPDSLQTIIKKHEAEKTFDSPEYLKAVEIYYQKHVAMKLPWSEDVVNTFKYINQEVYTHMCGMSEFTITGNLKDYDRTDRLHEIKVPTLFITGEFDEARPETVEHFHSLVPNSKFVIIKNSAHMTMQDNPEQDIKEIRDFLKEVEK